MPRPRKTPAGKQAVQLAVSNAGKALAAMIETLDANAVELSQTEFEKAFGFVHRTVATLEAQARKDRMLKTAGQFSFDDEDTPAPMPAPVTQRVAERAPLAPANPVAPVPASLSASPADAPVVARVIESLSEEDKKLKATPEGVPIRPYTGRLSEHAGTGPADKPEERVLDPNAGKHVLVRRTDIALKPNEKMRDSETGTVYDFMEGV